MMKCLEEINTTIMYRSLIKWKDRIVHGLLMLSLFGALIASGKILRSFFLGTGIAAGLFIFGEIITAKTKRKINRDITKLKIE